MKNLVGHTLTTLWNFVPACTLQQRNISNCKEKKDVMEEQEQIILSCMRAELFSRARKQENPPSNKSRVNPGSALAKNNRLVFFLSKYMKYHIFQLRKNDLKTRMTYNLISLNKFRLPRDSNPLPPRYRCSALPTDLSSQLTAGHVASS